MVHDPTRVREKMSQAGGIWRCVIVCPVKMIVESVKIILCNKMVFTCIMLLTTLPLSTLTISQSISTRSLTSQIHHLEALAQLATTRVEARHVWLESRHEALSLLRTKALFSLPSYLLSLAAAFSSVHSSVHSKPSRSSLTRLFATSIFVYAILFAFSPIPRALPSLSPSIPTRLLLFAICSALELYLMAVMSLSLVVSVAEERFGWDAIRVGSAVMEGNRVCGWVLSGLFVSASSLIGSKLQRLMDGQDFIAVEDKASVIVSYGLLVLLSYVIMTVFYCDCRRRHPIREPPQQPQPDEQQKQHQLSVM